MHSPRKIVNTVDNIQNNRKGLSGRCLKLRHNNQIINVCTHPPCIKLSLLQKLGVQLQQYTRNSNYAIMKWNVDDHVNYFAIEMYVKDDHSRDA